MSGPTSINRTNGLDTSVTTQLLLSQQAQNATNQGALAAMHKESMGAMKAAMAEMRASQASSDRKFEQMVYSMQSQANTMMMSMSSIMNSMMNMMGPAMMGGMGSGFGNSVIYGKPNSSGTP